MKIVTWIIHILLAALFLMAGMAKVFTPYEEIITDPNMQWTFDFEPLEIMTIGILEFLGALGLILPIFMKKLRVLLPISALALGAVMTGAMITHISRGESVLMNVIILIMTLALAWLKHNHFKKQVS